MSVNKNHSVLGHPAAPVRCVIAVYVLQMYIGDIQRIGQRNACNATP